MIKEAFLIIKCDFCEEEVRVDLTQEDDETWFVHWPTVTLTELTHWTVKDDEHYCSQDCYEMAETNRKYKDC